MKKTLFIFLLLIAGVSVAQAPHPSILQLKAPETFRAVFKTQKGDFTIEVYKKWSPLGADRLYQLISSGFFTDALFFRVESDYVVQFGISANNMANRFWDPKKLRDEPSQFRNEKGVISFARGGRNDRATQLFVNMTDNPRLDLQMRNGVLGYTPVARVIKGMDNLFRLNAMYGKAPARIQDSLYKYGNPYFDKMFPGLDRILSVTILK